MEGGLEFHQSFFDILQLGLPGKLAWSSSTLPIELNLEWMGFLALSSRNSCCPVGHLEPAQNSSNQLEAASGVGFAPDPDVLHLDLVHLLVPVLHLEPKHHFELVHWLDLYSELAEMALQSWKAPMVSWTS